ncbi:MAG TPA: hypothetical protein VFH60_00305 [Chloroflexia bacterium]|nr:hypothetical protein [Chloroflexia bacterium]
MTTRNNPRSVTTRSISKRQLSATLVAAGAMLLLALLSIAALPATSQAAQPSSGPRPILQAEPTQALPTAQTDVTNQQGGSEEDNSLQGGSTENDSNSAPNSNSNANEQNRPTDNLQGGSTEGGNPLGNTGGSDSPGGGFPWWIPIILVLLIAISIPFLRRRPFNEPATNNPAPDLERRDQQ